MLITTNGTTTIDVDSGREYVLSASGTFGGGTLTPKWSDGTTDVTIAGAAGDIAMTAGGAYVIIAPDSFLRIVLAGATSPNIKVNIVDRLR
jgi:hypothetical protein